MAEEVVTTGTPEVVTPEPTSLIDVQATPEVDPNLEVDPNVTPEVDPDKTIEEDPDKKPEEEDNKFDEAVVMEKFGDLLPEDILKGLLTEFNEGKKSGKQMITDILNEVGIAKDEMEDKLDNEIQTVKKNLIDKPIEGVDLKELGGWVSKQGEEMVNIATTLTDFALGEDAVRSAIALLNRVRMGVADVGDPDVKVVQKTTITRDSLREEYMNIYQTEEGINRINKINGLIKKAETTGDPELADWAKQMFNM